MHVRERFLNDSKESDFLLARKPAEVSRDLECDIDIAALRKSLDIPLNRRRQPYFVQRGWM